ncbi:hypothetical protein Vafri_7096 [Volvox africanus]|uniref:Uncharacterized protein n=1 Tax=Volvox africanus TaxID=51714 RepID=A0A8J4EWT7_9CHLO|nr:hypothetical protein Vafri_7096 [Volvox africanus]
MTLIWGLDRTCSTRECPCSSDDGPVVRDGWLAGCWTGCNISTYYRFVPKVCVLRAHKVRLVTLCIMQGSEGLTSGSIDVIPEDIEDHNYDALYQAACTLPEVIVDFGGQRARVLGGHCASCNAIFVTPVAPDTVPKHSPLQLKPNYENVKDETGLSTKQLPVPVSRPPLTLYGFWVYAKIKQTRVHPTHDAESELVCQQELRVIEPDGQAEMNLLEFLQRASAILGGHSLRALNMRVLWWDEADNEGHYRPRWYQAEIRAFNADKGSHRVGGVLGARRQDREDGVPWERRAEVGKASIHRLATCHRLSPLACQWPYVLLTWGGTGDLLE